MGFDSTFDAGMGASRENRSCCPSDRRIRRRRVDADRIQ